MYCNKPCRYSSTYPTRLRRPADMNLSTPNLISHRNESTIGVPFVTPAQPRNRNVLLLRNTAGNVIEGDVSVSSEHRAWR